MKRRPTFSCLLAGLLYFLDLSAVEAAPGDLDPGFSGEGKLRIGFGAGFGTGYDLVVQSDGKIVVVGVGSAGQSAFATARYQPDGAFDETFADNGIALTSVAPNQFGGSNHDEARAVGLQTDGKIVVVGYTQIGNNRDFALVRYHSDGTLDNSFGTNGRVTTDFGGLDEFGMDVAIQGDGKIVVAGSVQGNFAVARYNEDGSLDGSFGSAGKFVMTGIVGDFVFEAAVTLQNDGKILVAGSPTSGTSKAFYIIRLTPSGAYDSTFANNGLAVRGVGMADGGTCTSIAIQPGTFAISSPDKIVVAGYAYDGTREVFALMRFNLDGNLDTSFDGDGVLTTDVFGIAGASARAQDVKVEAGSQLGIRKIIVTGTLFHSSGGTSVSESVVVRYNSNGSLDTSLDGDGALRFDPIFSPTALAVFAGKIITAGGTQGRFALARFNSDGAFDASFDQDGMRVDEIGSTISAARGVAIQADGKIVVAGSGGAVFGAGIAVSRLNSDATFDKSFDGDGRAVALPLNSEGGNAVVIQPDGKILVAGTISGSNSADAAVVRFDLSGAIDATFGGGTARSQTPGRDVANAVAVQSDGKVVVAGYVTPGPFNRDHQILRFNTDGMLDSSFDFDGRVSNGFGAGDDEARGVVIQPDGKIVVAGYASNAPKQILVTRYNPNGSLDSAFDGDGAIFTNVGGGDAVGNALVLDPAGRILVAGFSSNGTNYDITVVRYLPNGSLDSSFGTGGKVVTAVSAGDDVGNAIALQPDGKILVAGVVHPNAALGSGTLSLQGSYVLVRYLPDGSLDLSYGSGGKVLLDFQTLGNDGANALALDGNARAVMAGEAGQLFGIARLDPGPLAPPTSLANISTRLRVETGDNVLIGGFIVTGTQPKKVILRAIGPSLNLAGQLSNPTLELYTGSTLLAANDDWQNQPAADRQAVIDSTIPPTNDLESALVATLPANNSAYTAIVRGVNDTIGVGVVEAYDLDRTTDSKLANISTRGFVQTGDNVLIAGTIILGEFPQRVIVRAIGPSLPVAGKMENPNLELRDQNGAVLDANDNWVDSPNKQAIIDSSIPPTNDLESAIVASLPSNGANYTAIVRGVNDTTGIAVVEVYALQ
jgi:uncharacterized delta-60 repeat protein